MKSLTKLLAVGIATVSAATPDLRNKEFQDELLQQNLPAFIKKAQGMTVLPIKEGLTLINHSLKSTSKVKEDANERLLSFEVTLQDQDKSTYSGTLVLHYKITDNTSHLSSAIINSWDNSNASNKDLPQRVNIQYPVTVYKENITQEVYDAIPLKTVTENEKVAEVVQGLSKILTDVKISHANYDSLNFSWKTFYFTASTTNTYTEATVGVTVTGKYKGKEHTYFISAQADKSGHDLKGVSIKRVYAKKEDLCDMLVDVSYTKAVKDLQEKNFITNDTLTLKKHNCAEVSYNENDSKRFTHVVDMEVENSQNIVFKFQAKADINTKTGLFNYYGKVDNVDWDTSAAKVQNNALFPTKEYKPSFDCKAEMLKDIKSIPFDQEIPDRLFKYVFDGTPISSPKEIEGKKYTVSDVKVQAIHTNCWSEDEANNLLYQMTGVLTTSDGLKFNAELVGYYLSEPFEERSKTKKLMNLFRKPDRFYNRLSAKIVKVTLMK